MSFQNPVHPHADPAPLPAAIPPGPAPLPAAIPPGPVLLPAPAIHRLSVKLPPFWPDKPALWFAQAEAQFAVAAVTRDETKYFYVVSQLDCRYAAEVEDIITAPPVQDKYNVLKDQLIRRMSLSQEQRIRQLLMVEELGDRKPSQFLRHLRSLAGTTGINDNLLRTLWLQRLPSQAQAILQVQANLPLDQAADVADKILEVTSTQIALVSQTDDSSTNAISTLTDQVENLTRQIAALQQRSQHVRSRFRKFPERRGRSKVRFEDEKNQWCWYHERFFDKAAKCIKPCIYPNFSNSNQ